jgi:hypothetical protein
VERLFPGSVQNRGHMELFRKLVAWLAIAAGCFGVVMTVRNVPLPYRKCSLSFRTSCVANLRTIEGAVQTWRLEYPHASNSVPVWSEIAGATLYIREKPMCPAGGVYSLPAPGQKPTCSIKDHAL